MLIYRLILVSVLASAPGLALAQAEYSAADVIGHFDQPETAAAVEACPEGSVCLPKQATRAVCIGTTSACAGEVAAAAPAAPEGFDLLITFELGSDRLSEQAQANLREFANAMNDPALDGTMFNVDGHTDARGSKSLNDGLSRRRAQVVVEFLESLGVDQSRLQAHGYGESQPRADDPFAAINRRVEATIRTR